MTLPPVYILLLNYRGAFYTLNCLDSLKALVYPDYRVLVIDNASGDDSISRFQERLAVCPDEFELLESPHNLGFSAGNNLGIQVVLNRHPEGEAFIWLLNNDTTVQADTLQHLVEEARRTGGLVGSLLKYPQGEYQQAGTRIGWWSGRLRGYPEADLKDGMPVDTLSGASMLIPLHAFRKIGLMDARFFLYCEDGEFSLRCREAGYPLTLAKESVVYHAESATTGKSSLRTQYYYQRNRLYLLAAYAKPWQWVSIQLYSLFRLLRSVVKCLLKPSPEHQQSLKVHWLASRDFYRGVTGPCPHPLENL